MSDGGRWRDEVEPEETLRAGCLEFTLATGCFHHLQWNITALLPVSMDLERLDGALRAAGWVEGATLAGLRDYAAPEGGAHLVAVPAAAWLQLRLSYLVPLEARVPAARGFAEWLAALIEQTMSRSALPSDRR